MPSRYPRFEAHLAKVVAAKMPNERQARIMEHRCGGCGCELCTEVANAQQPWEDRRDTIVRLGLEEMY